MTKKRILHLVVKKKFFDMISCGEKPEEYRDITDHWIRRLIDWRSINTPDDFAVYNEFMYDLQNVISENSRHRSLKELMDYFNAEFKPFTHVCFQLGYSATAARCTVKLNEISVGVPKPKWCGGQKLTDVTFVIKLGGRIRS